MSAYRQESQRGGRTGLVSVLAVFFLAIFAAVGVAFFSVTSLEATKSANLRAGDDARMAAESGLSFLTYQLENCGVSGALRGQPLLDSLAGKLQTAMNGSANLGGRTVAYNNSTITIPSIAMDGGRSFTGQIVLTAADTVQLTVTGQSSASAGPSGSPVRRQVAISLQAQWDPALGFGMCSQGPVSMGNNTDLVGRVYASDGSIYSGAPSIAVDCGSGVISGNVSISTPGASVSLASVSNEQGGPVTVIYNAPPVTMPNINTAAYTALATTVMSSASPAGGTYTNIRIPPNTNPTFGNAVTLQGVIYVQSPNVVTFSNNCTFTGVLVADPQAPGSTDAQNDISFKNNMTFNGVEQLPDFYGSIDLRPVKDLPGSVILAPGFNMEFKNNANLLSADGVIALKSLTIKNNLDCQLLGSMLIYGSAGLSLKNNSDITISLSGSSPAPGFAGYGLPPLLPVPATYREY